MEFLIDCSTLLIQVTLFVLAYTTADLESMVMSFFVSHG